MMEHILGATDPDAAGPLGTCACCGTTGHMHRHAAEGWLCRRCYLKASTVFEVRIIDGKRFTLRLKAKAPTAGTAGAERRTA